MRIYIDVSPCEGCVRVKDPEQCDNKGCQLWKRWFLARWAGIHAYPRRLMEQKTKPVGVMVGGNCYAAPHQVRAYLASDPCSSCICTPDLCKTPCRARQNWAKAQEGVTQ